MRDSIHPARLTRSWRAHLLAAALLLSVVSVAGCTGSSGTTAHGTATARGTATPDGVVSDCLLPPTSCYAPHLFQVEYGIQPLLDGGIDGRGETVTVLAPAPSPSAPSPSGLVTAPPGAFPAATDIRPDLAAFDSMFRLAVSSQVRRTIAIRDGKTSSETIRHAATDERGTTTLHAREYATLDRAGRVQLPREMTRRLGMRNRVELQEEPDHIGVWPDQAADQERE